MNVEAPVTPADSADVLDVCTRALASCDRLSAALFASLRQTLSSSDDGNEALNQHQAVAHGYAWFATYVRALHELHGWAQRLAAAGRLGALELLMLQGGFGEYLAQLLGGLPMSQGEIFRAAALDASGAARAQFARDPAVDRLMRDGFSTANRAQLVALLEEGRPSRQFGDPGYGDPLLEEIRKQFARFADDHAAAAHQWHTADTWIPDAVLDHLGRLGVFGLTIPEAYGGSAMDKIAMCVVTEELSRGYIGLGSLGTRSEIACELIRAGGTEEQKTRFLPGIASGRIIAAAAFTEPDVGSDLASITTRAQRHGDIYRIQGNKTWLTHGARCDVMIMLVRTNPRERGYRGLSLLLVEKPRGTEQDPFPAPRMSGGEIPVLGYRGMKEYEVAFDGFEVPASALLGGEEGQGFKQLMETFESARIQTAARAVGVAQCAFELGLDYAHDRRQFDRPILAFPRVGDKLAWMAIETMLARQLTYFAARQKDAGQRCDTDAGMAKLLAARVAWANADNAVQIHGGNGYALEYRISRVLCDARILSIFEGAAEIQAHIVVKGLLKP